MLMPILVTYTQAWSTTKSEACPRSSDTSDWPHILFTMAGLCGAP